jgi:AcrR family transcriptional regulator
MGKSGSPSRVKSAETRDSEGTRLRLIEATITSLAEEGFAGTSAREIGRRAGCNQALVFYHFGSVANLLLAALDEISRIRMERYRAGVEAVSSLDELVAVAIDIFREDLDSHHATVLAQLIAGSSSIPGFGSEVAARIEPWTDFTQQVVTRVIADSPFASMVDSAEIAFAIVAFYLGIELLTNLKREREPAEDMFATVGRVAGLFGAFGSFAGTAGPTADEAIPELGRS